MFLPIERAGIQVARMGKHPSLRSETIRFCSPSCTFVTLVAIKVFQPPRTRRYTKDRLLNQSKDKVKLLLLRSGRCRRCLLQRFAHAVAPLANLVAAGCTGGELEVPIEILDDGGKFLLLDVRIDQHKIDLRVVGLQLFGLEGFLPTAYAMGCPVAPLRGGSDFGAGPEGYANSCHCGGNVDRGFDANGRGSSAALSRHCTTGGIDEHSTFLRGETISDRNRRRRSRASGLRQRWETGHCGGG